DRVTNDHPSNEHQQLVQSQSALRDVRQRLERSVLALPTFSGHGSRTLAGVTIRAEVLVDWTAPGGPLRVASGRRTLLASPAGHGLFHLRAGRYPNLLVNTRGHWSLRFRTR